MINVTSDWWEWAEATIVNQLRVAALYNGQPPYGLRGYIGETFLTFIQRGIMDSPYFLSLIKIYVAMDIVKIVSQPS